MGINMTASNGKVEVKNTTCYMCACRCGIRVTLNDGVVRYIQGNPEHPLNKGVICAKGSSGIMKQYSPARLTQPLKRKEGAERGDSEFEAISWDEAFDILEKRLGHIRETDPSKFALFTGRDQMQGLTGLWARNFGTPNYAAHGGFCSVNMAAGMIYSIGGSFWEFGGPDVKKAKVLMMFGTAEDHHSNPLKIQIGEFKRSGGRFISVNPVRTGYSAVADEWVPIKPGTDGAFIMAMMRVILDEDLYDKEFLIDYTNAGQLVIDEPLRNDHGMLARDDHGRELWWDGKSGGAVPFKTEGADVQLFGDYKLVDGTKVRPAFQLLADRIREYTPEAASQICGIPVADIYRLGRELGDTAMNQGFEMPMQWTDAWGKKHDKIIGRPVAFHAMRGLAAHSNGFQTIRAFSMLMTILGTIDRPGGFRHKAPYPRPIPPGPAVPNKPEDVQPGRPLNGAPLGSPASPDDLFVDENGNPLRIDKAFSWEHPLSLHGLMHNAITNAWRQDPYKIDTLLIFMANMAWNSTMNTSDVRTMLNDKEEDGTYKIPFLVVCDAFQSEMVAYADLVLPDTTYLERHDCISMLDRPISEYEGPVDSVRIPVLPPTGQCKPFQEVLVELGSRLKFPVFTTEDGKRKYKDYPEFITNFEVTPGCGIGFLAGWRGKNGDKFLKGEPNPNQWKMYEENNCVYHYHMPEHMQYMRNWNKDYLDWAYDHLLITKNAPIIPHIYSEIVQQFRLAAEGKREGKQPPEHLRERVKTFFDPLPFFYTPLEEQRTDTDKYPLNALTQRPMAMYHSWDSQNAWLRQIHTYNYLYMSPKLGEQGGFNDGDWVWVESMHGKVRCMCRFSEAVEPGTVWTWNAVGKASGAWGLEADANESRKGFLLNHVISEELPPGPEGDHISNSDPITGQAGWYDVRVRVYKADDNEEQVSWPQFKTQKTVPGQPQRKSFLAYFAGRK
ncbi:MAG: molybdopterin oxidoreductase family protein [Gammaproteobacteria bacterium]|nr:molybdopterin oxidoreductase family protein [Gammaproteobacteria bacterium]